MKTSYLSAFTRFCIYCMVIFTPLCRGGVKGWCVMLIHLTTTLAVTAYLVEKIVHPQTKWIHTRMDKPLVAVAVLGAISTVFSNHFYTSMFSILLFANYTAIFYLVVQVFNTRIHQRRLIYIIIGTGFFLSVIGLLKRYELNPFPWWEYRDLKYPRAFLSATFGNHNHLAGYLEMAIPLVLGIFLFGLDLKKRLLLLYCLIMMAAAFILSLSRGGWLGGISGISLMGVLLLSDKRFKQKKMIYISSALFFAGIVLFMGSTTFVERFISIYRQEGHHSFHSRWIVWESVWEMILAFPLSGVGPGLFSTCFTQFQPADIDRRYYMAHNDYLQFISEIGLILLPVIFWMIVVTYRKGFRNLKSPSRHRRGIGYGVLAGITAILVHSFVDFNLHIPANAILFTIFCALVFAPTSHHVHSQESTLDFRTMSNWFTGSKIGLAGYFRKFHSNGNITFLARNSVVAFGIAVGNVIAVLIMNILMARWMGVEQFGIYSYVMTIVVMLSVVCQMGFNNGVVRFVSGYFSTEKWDRMRGLIIRSSQIVLISSGIAAVIGVGLTYLSSTALDPQLTQCLYIGFLTTPFIVFLHLKEHVLRSIKKIAMSVFPSQIIIPVLFLIMITSLQYFGKLDVGRAMISNLTATAVALMVTSVYVTKSLPSAVLAVKPVFETRHWLTVSLPMLFASIMQIILNRTDILMLGALAGMPAVGLYKAAFQISQLNTFTLTAVNQAFAPMISGLWAKKEKKELQHILSLAIFITFMATLPLSLGIFFGSETILSVYNKEFMTADWALKILTLGQLVNLSVGPVGFLLIMTGAQNIFLAIVGTGAIINIVLNYLMIPRYGIEGAAAVTSATMIFWNIAMLVAVHKKTGLASYLRIPGVFFERKRRKKLMQT